MLDWCFHSALGLALGPPPNRARGVVTQGSLVEWLLLLTATCPYPRPQHGVPAESLVLLAPGPAQQIDLVPTQTWVLSPHPHTCLCLDMA